MLSGSKKLHWQLLREKLLLPSGVACRSGPTALLQWPTAQLHYPCCAAALPLLRCCITAWPSHMDMSLSDVCCMTHALLASNNHQATFVCLATGQLHQQGSWACTVFSGLTVDSPLCQAMMQACKCVGQHARSSTTNRASSSS